MRTWLDAALTSLAILLAVPAFLILASWNALPGDSLYGVKTSLEKVALAITIKTPLASMLSLNFTDRRFNEANRLLAKDGSTLGYSLLVAQATQSKDIISEKQDVKQATALIKNIEGYQKSIEEKKVALATQPSAVVPASIPVSAPATIPTISPTVAPTAVPTPIAKTPAPAVSTIPTPAPVSTTPVVEPTPAPSVEVVIDDLDQTNEKLEDLKQEIKRNVPGSGFRESGPMNIPSTNPDIFNNQDNRNNRDNRGSNERKIKD